MQVDRDMLDRSKKSDEYAEEARKIVNGRIFHSTLSPELVKDLRSTAHFSNAMAIDCEEGLRSGMLTEEEKKQVIHNHRHSNAVAKAYEAAANRLEAELKRSGS